MGSRREDATFCHFLHSTSSATVVICQVTFLSHRGNSSFRVIPYQEWCMQWSCWWIPLWSVFWWSVSKPYCPLMPDRLFPALGFVILWLFLGIQGSLTEHACCVSASAHFAFTQEHSNTTGPLLLADWLQWCRGLSQSFKFGGFLVGKKNKKRRFADLSIHEKKIILSLCVLTALPSLVQGPSGCLSCRRGTWNPVS